MCIHQFTTLVIKLVFVAVAWLNLCTVVLMQRSTGCFVHAHMEIISVQ